MTKTTTALVLMIQALTLSLAVASEGGGGHNGPDFKGTSIDLAFDRTPLRGDVEKVIGSCLNITLQDTMATIWKKPGLVLEQSGSFFREILAEQGSLEFYARDAAYDRERNDVGAKLTGSSSKKGSPGSSVYFEITAPVSPDARVSRVNAILHTKGFPFHKIPSEEVSDVSYSDLGIKLERKSEPVTTLTLYQEEGVDSYPLYNSDRKLNYSVNAKKYVDCIRASL